MPGQAPLIDRRTYGDLVAEVETLAGIYTAGEVGASVETLTGAVLDQDVLEGSETVAAAGQTVDAALARRISEIEDLGPVRVRGWRPQDPPDAGSALVRVFSRMAELVISRLNRVPERDFLSFLDLIGTQPRPPQPARVPLTFHLAEGSPVDALVPARTQVAATPLEGETEPVLFETERDLLVTRTVLAAVFTREPGRDLYSENTAVATGQAEGIFQPFRGDRPIPHRIYVGHAGLLGLPEEKAVEVHLQTEPLTSEWLADVAWERWDGTAWQPVPASLQIGSPSVFLFDPLPQIPSSVVDGVSSSWMRGSFQTPLARDEVLIDEHGRTSLKRSGLTASRLVSFRTYQGAQYLDPQGAFYPFGETALRPDLYLTVPEAFKRAGTQAEIEILLDEAQPPSPSNDLKLQWEILGIGPFNSYEFVPVEPVPAGARIEPFLVSGTVFLQIPSGWPVQSPFDEDGRWLKVSVIDGGFGTGTFRPPRVKSLRVRTFWQLPSVYDVQVGARVDAREEDEQILPDRGFSNQVPLDLSKDFLPFGEKPKAGDTFYLAADEVLSKPDAEVSLDVALTNVTEGNVPPPAEPTRDLILAWEFWDGRRWQLLGTSGEGAGNKKKAAGPYGLVDNTAAFTREADVTFRVPAALVPVEVGGEARRWIRVRIAAGNYGLEARYEPIGQDEQGRPMYQLVPATFKPPSIRSIQVGYVYQPPFQAPEALITENDSRFQQVTGFGPYQAFDPFQVSEDLRPTLYLGFDRPGDIAGFANRTVTLYFGVAGALYEPATEQRGVLEEAVVAWEYWNGAHWQRLGTRDETRGLVRRGLLTFIGPPDFRASTELGRPAFWLRGRWERGSYAAEPELRRILTNTTWAVHARTIEDEALGSSRGERGQVFRTVQTPVLEGQRLEVVEPEMPSASEREELEHESGGDAVRTVPDPAGQAAQVRVLWHAVPDFYGSGPRIRHYTIDRATGEIRFGDGQRGLVPPLGRNNIRMALYRSGGGVAGNRPAGNIVQLRGTVPYVDSVLQYEPAGGGAAEESLAMLEARGPRTLRHRDRAVALADFEDLAVQATTEVARARCIPARDGADAGTVGLIVVPLSTEAQPVPTLELLGRVRSYIEARLSPVVDLWVVGPDWLRVTVTAEVVPQLLEAATDVQTAVLERVTSFLHPLTGGPGAPAGSGWEFGRKPYRSDLYALIEATPGVDHVRQLRVRMEGSVRPERFLVYSGDHGIAVTGNTDDIAESAEGSGSPA